MNTEELRKDLERRRTRKALYAELQDEETQAIAKVEAQLAEAEKPELRHGDYGIRNHTEFWICINGRVYWNNGQLSSLSDARFIESRLGNIFDDLKALAKPLKEFKVNNGPYETVTIMLGAGMLRFNDADGCILIKESEIPEFIRNLRRLIFTAEKERSK